MPEPADNPPPAPTPMARQVWWFSDGKPGHESQAIGLLDAMQKLGPFEVHQVDCRRDDWQAHLRKLAKPPGPQLPADLCGGCAMDAVKGLGVNKPFDPRGTRLLLGVGRATHKPMRWAKRNHTGLCVVLMNPGWPRRGFDLCVIPKHDGVAPSDRVITTDGAISKVRPSKNHDASHGVLLVGGPSKHHNWNRDEILAALRDIVQRSTHITHWHATSSRRTPSDTEEALADLGESVTFTPASETPPGWVADQLATAGTCWVTADSVSMVYESLTSGCRVGLLPVPVQRRGRVTRGVSTLIQRGWVTTYEGWQESQQLPKPDQPLDEATRIANEVWQRCR